MIESVRRALIEYLSNLDPSNLDLSNVAGVAATGTKHTDR